MDSLLADRPFRRILIIKPSSIGDVIHALPMLRALRLHWPDAHLAWLISPGCADIIRHNRLLDELVPFDRAQYGRIATSWSAARDFLTFLRELRRKRFDLVVDAQGLFRSGFLSWATGAGARLGFNTAREFAWIFHTHHAPDTMKLHAVDRMMAMLTRHGIPDTGRDFTVELSAEADRGARALLAEAGLAPPARFAAVVPGARWQTKRWAWEKYAQLVDAAAKRLDLPGVLLGSPDERAVCQRVRDSADSRPANLAGRTDLLTAGAILKRASVVVCNDSGASMHLAAALHRPLVAVFGPTNPRRTGPYGAMAGVVSAGAPCAPCYLRSIDHCRHGMACMKGVSVNEVLERVRQAIARIDGADACPNPG